MRDVKENFIQKVWLEVYKNIKNYTKNKFKTEEKDFAKYIKGVGLIYFLIEGQKVLKTEPIGYEGTLDLDDNVLTFLANAICRYFTEISMNRKEVLDLLGSVSPLYKGIDQIPYGVTVHSERTHHSFFIVGKEQNNNKIGMLVVAITTSLGHFNYGWLNANYLNYLYKQKLLPKCEEFLKSEVY